MNFFLDCIKKIVRRPQKNKYAYVSVEDGVLGRENFPWKIEKSIGPKGDFHFTILGEFKDPSELLIIPDTPVNFSSALSDAGITITFSCLAEKIPNFRIEVK